MANNNIVPAAIVLELLDKDNYDHWSVLVETYLVAQDLWDVVEAPIPSKAKTEADKAWYKRNAAALHAIQISCSSDTFNVIRKIRWAKEAWDTLAANFSNFSSEIESKNLINNDPAKEGQEEENVDETGEEGQQDENVNENAVNSSEYMCFFHDVGEGNWEAVEQFLNLHQQAVRVLSPTYRRTALHVAVTFGHLHIVEELVKLMSAEELEIEDCDGFTAFLIAVDKGNMSMVECMLKENDNLLSIGTNSPIPVMSAIYSGQKKMARFLYYLTAKKQVLLENDGLLGATLINECIFDGMFDISLDLITRYPDAHFIIAKDPWEKTPIDALVCQHALFPSGFQLKFWQRWIYNCMCVPSQHSTNHLCLNIQNDDEDSTSNKWSIKFMLGIEHIYKLKVVHTQAAELLSLMCKEIKTLDEGQITEAQLHIAIQNAAGFGTVELITEISKAIPKTMWTNRVLFNVFEMAIKNRQPKVFSLIHGIDYKQAIARLANSNRETLSHVAGYIAPPEKLNQDAGAALQMQRELQWFKEVESISSEGTENAVNNLERSSRQIFTESHKDLMSAGEKWMKDISSSCSFVGALIFTIMFTAAFTLPGGNNQNTGFPMFIDKKLFKIFIISDAISLFSSTTSVLTFLGILTSRYAEDDFLISLPRKMILGLSTLFLSIATMMISFCAAITLLFHKQLWIVAPIILIACIPVTLFVFLQFPLLVDIFRSTYGRSIFDRKVKNWLV